MSKVPLGQESKHEFSVEKYTLLATQLWHFTSVPNNPSGRKQFSQNFSGAPEHGRQLSLPEKFGSLDLDL